MKLITGIACIIFGSIVLYSVIKHPNKREFSEGILAPNFSGYGSGIGLILIGIALINEWF